MGPLLIPPAIFPFRDPKAGYSSVTAQAKGSTRAFLYRKLVELHLLTGFDRMALPALVVAPMVRDASFALDRP